MSYYGKEREGMGYLQELNELVNQLEHENWRLRELAEDMHKRLEEHAPENDWYDEHVRAVKMGVAK